MIEFEFEMSTNRADTVVMATADANEAGWA